MAYTFTPYDVLQVLRGGEWLDYSTIRTAEESEIAIRHVMNDGRDYGQDAPFRITNGRDTIKLEKPPTAAQEAAARSNPTMADTKTTGIATALKLMAAIANATSQREIAELTRAAREISATELRSEVDSLTHDLQIAARRYDECITSLSTPDAEQFRTAIFTFEQQAKRARAQAEALEGIEEF